MDIAKEAASEGIQGRPSHGRLGVHRQTGIWRHSQHYRHFTTVTGIGGKQVDKNEPTSVQGQMKEGKHQAKWSVMPSTGHLHAGETKTISVTVTVLDPSTVSASLLVHVEHSRVINIGLFASASGCGILTEPKIFPEIDLGYLFSRRLYQFTIKLHNPGTRHHMIHFIPDRLSIRSGSVPVLSLFRFVPYKFDLEGGQSTEIILEGQSNREFEVSESFVCWAIINKRGIKQNLGSIQIKANFIMPMIELSERSLEFEINIGPHSSQGQTDTRTMALKNISNLPVTVVLELAHPFLISESETSRSTENILSLNPYTEREVAVGFWPPVQCSLQSTTYHSALQISYKEHPQRWVRRLSQDNQIKQRRAWLLFGQVTAERSCPCKRPACPAIGGGSEVTFKPLVPRLSVREGFLALTSPDVSTSLALWNECLHLGEGLHSTSKREGRDLHNNHWGYKMGLTYWKSTEVVSSSASNLFLLYQLFMIHVNFRVPILVQTI
ncbi:hypothetical protein J6590_097799 [Homalodisca vitripennis]|nr:hypothetical protein J6590_097799 [Homalodisca vitripennis]